MQAIKAAIYQTQQIRDLEQLAETHFAVPAQVMMQRAGKAALDFLLKRWPNANRLAIFCGAGNNGGDGYVLAQLAHERGMEVTIWQVGSINKLKNEAKQAYDACEKGHLNMRFCDESAEINHSDVIVDAICGIGLKDALRPDAVIAVKKMQQAQAPILSIDIPTGISADTGEVLGIAVHANATITFIGLKLGLLTGHGIAHTGELILNDLQLPTELFSQVKPIAEKIQSTAYTTYLKPRTKDWHKGLSGHVLVIGGALGLSGAPRMAAEAALRVGAGLVTVATRPEHAALINLTCPELMCHGVTDSKQLEPLLEKADVIVLGPGLGQSEWAKSLWNAALQTNLPVIVDADGLNILSQSNITNERWILTPHPGEAARLLHVTSDVIQGDRLSALYAIQKNYGGVCVLKGAGSLVLSPNALPVLCDKGNPGMASAGMGDVLSGVIGGLAAQRIPLGDAAKLGVYIHAVAGDMAAKEGERGLLAMDLMPYLRRLCNTTP